MDSQDLGFSLKSLNFEIEFERESETALINPVLVFESLSRRTLIAMLEIDGHELIPSARIQIESGSSEIRMKRVKIVRPAMESSYCIDLRISADGRNYQKHSVDIRIKDYLQTGNGNSG